MYASHIVTKLFSLVCVCNFCIEKWLVLGDPYSLFIDSVVNFSYKLHMYVSVHKQCALLCDSEVQPGVSML